MRLSDGTPPGADPVVHVVLVQRADGTRLGIEPIYGTTAEVGTPHDAATAAKFHLSQRLETAPHEHSLYAQAAAALGARPVIAQTGTLSRPEAP
ncbi:hypothetical protein AB0F13_27560 [Streptomyces sp. NPDC026206]|uniref:hypothetical protein n=1 Tax=Streptomyces sp. NPDC026206 TaxID=3157089 RepID=UPI0033FECFF4